VDTEDERRAVEGDVARLAARFPEQPVDRISAVVTQELSTTRSPTSEAPTVSCAPMIRQLVVREEERSAELETRVPALVRKALKRGRFLET
jgi:hypothetical protein